MHKLSKATTILFAPEDYKRLKKLARFKAVSVAELIRRAVEEKYLLTSEDMIQAVEALSELNAPIGTPQQMEWEIEKGRLK